MHKTVSSNCRLSVNSCVSGIRKGKKPITDCYCKNASMPVYLFLVVYSDVLPAKIWMEKSYVFLSPAVINMLKVSNEKISK